ncbi:MAG: sigma-70 family RNA polymerase sigma factor [Oscillospiraceae bacterium]
MDDRSLMDRIASGDEAALQTLLRRHGPLLQQERSRLLVRAVKSLTDGEQTLFYRKYYYCQSTAQMAAELGLTERGVEGRLYRLRQKLRELLGGDFCE